MSTNTLAAAPAPRLSLREGVLRYNFLAIFALVVLIATRLSDNFLTWHNIANLFQQAAIVGIVAVGMTFVILTANIDLSVGSLVAFGGMLVATLLTQGLPIALAVALTLASGALIGAGIGALSIYARVPSFIITLAALVSFRGLTYLISDGTPLGGLPQAFGLFGSLMLNLVPGLDLPFPAMGLAFITIACAAAWVLRRTVFGEYLRACGGNAEAARLSGVPIRPVVTAVFALSGLLATLGGVLLTSRLNIGQPTAAQGLELDAIAAVVLGGTSLFGGRGGVLGTAVAVMLLQVLRNIFNLLGLGSFYQMTMTGVIIVAAILLNRLLDHHSGRS
ncbi:ABC transporter permease [Verminephrobacter aporrectodeae subsp. tuberculatae]|uniref:ABC transporter permease n=1 Tax=Verminephrobacter aporrectodeae TaxID=1110389 RepID=UPI0022437E1C|nr:ABC transporter permease [Verminephrobacter aporrectodeae]MCW8198857.1 ABC transporter permease [Verminephrobacter aporrectodeae subsp. tuberculatae]